MFHDIYVHCITTNIGLNRNTKIKRLNKFIPIGCNHASFEEIGNRHKHLMLV